MPSSKLLYVHLLLATRTLASSTQFTRINQTNLTSPVVIYPEDTPFPGHHSVVGIYENYGEGVDIPSTLMGESIEVMASKIVQDKLGLADSEVFYKSGYAGETAEYAYLAQSHNGIQFANAVANLALKGGKIVSFGSSFVKPIKIATQYPSIQVSEAIQAAEMVFPGNYSGHPTKLEYFYKQDGSAALVHSIQIQDIDRAVSLEVYMDAHTGEAVASTNFVSFAKYRGVPIYKYSVLQGGLYDMTDPQDELASPIGWYRTYGQHEFTSPKRKGYVAKKHGRVHVANMVHDITYRYGFTEVAFNYQLDNFKRGGKDRDYITMYVQDKSDMDNAFFIPAPDGQIFSPLESSKTMYLPHTLSRLVVGAHIRTPQIREWALSLG